MTDTELSNYANEAAARCTALKAALDANDYDRVYALAGDVATLVQMAADAATRLVAAPTMSQAMRLMTSQDHVEWYTPPWVLDLARQVLGVIDLDPASCAVANQTVQAARYYTKDDDGYSKPWQGRVWLNPPFDDTGRWARRLAAAYVDGDVSAALMLVNSAPGYTWYEELADVWPAIQLRKRLAFVRGDGNTNKDKGGLAKKSQTLFYFGPDIDRFETIFTPHGRRLHTPNAAPRGLFEVAA